MAATPPNYIAPQNPFDVGLEIMNQVNQNQAARSYEQRQQQEMLRTNIAIARNEEEYQRQKQERELSSKFIAAGVSAQLNVFNKAMDAEDYGEAFFAFKATSSLLGMNASDYLNPSTAAAAMTASQLSQQRPELANVRTVMLDTLKQSPININGRSVSLYDAFKSAGDDNSVVQAMTAKMSPDQKARLAGMLDGAIYIPEENEVVSGSWARSFIIARDGGVTSQGEKVAGDPTLTYKRYQEDVKLKTSVMKSARELLQFGVQNDILVNDKDVNGMTALQLVQGYSATSNSTYQFTDLVTGEPSNNSVKAAYTAVKGLLDQNFDATTVQMALSASARDDGKVNIEEMRNRAGIYNKARNQSGLLASAIPQDMWQQPDKLNAFVDAFNSTRELSADGKTYRQKQEASLFLLMNPNGTVRDNVANILQDSSLSYPSRTAQLKAYMQNNVDNAAMWIEMAYALNRPKLTNGVGTTPISTSGEIMSLEQLVPLTDTDTIGDLYADFQKHRELYVSNPARFISLARDIRQQNLLVGDSRQRGSALYYSEQNRALTQGLRDSLLDMPLPTYAEVKHDASQRTAPGSKVQTFGMDDALAGLGPQPQGTGQKAVSASGLPLQKETFTIDGTTADSSQSYVVPELVNAANVQAYFAPNGGFESRKHLWNNLLEEVVNNGDYSGASEQLDSFMGKLSESVPGGSVKYTKLRERLIPMLRAKVEEHANAVALLQIDEARKSGKTEVEVTDVQTLLGGGTRTRKINIDLTEGAVVQNPLTEEAMPVTDYVAGLRGSTAELTDQQVQRITNAAQVKQYAEAYRKTNLGMRVANTDAIGLFISNYPTDAVNHPDMKPLVQMATEVRGNLPWYTRWGAWANETMLTADDADKLRARFIGQDMLTQYNADRLIPFATDGQTNYTANVLGPSIARTTFQKVDEQTKPGRVEWEKNLGELIQAAAKYAERKILESQDAGLVGGFLYDMRPFMLAAVKENPQALQEKYDRVTSKLGYEFTGKATGFFASMERLDQQVEEVAKAALTGKILRKIKDVRESPLAAFHKTVQEVYPDLPMYSGKVFVEDRKTKEVREGDLDLMSVTPINLDDHSEAATPYFASYKGFVGSRLPGYSERGYNATFVESYNPDFGEGPLVAYKFKVANPPKTE